MKSLIAEPWRGDRASPREGEARPRASSNLFVPLGRDTNSDEDVRAPLPAVSPASRAVRVLVLLACLLSCQAFAIEFVVEPRQVSVDESVKVTLLLDGDLATIDSVDLPLTNLETAGPPSTSSQFTMVNGVMSRKKTFTWWVSPINPGSAEVGPLQLETRDGGVVLVPSVRISVLPPSDLGASSPNEALERLYLAGRDEVILVAEAEPAHAVVGQEVVVTWTLFSAISLRGFAIVSIPELDAFWVEEDVVRDRSPRSARIGRHEVQRLEVRRASLFPIREGELEIPPLEVRVEVIRPLRDPFGGFSLLEGRVAEVRRRSTPITIAAKPPAVESDAIGRFQIRRTEPRVSAEGLVSFDVTVEGAGSLRAMPAPRLTAPLRGEVEIQDAGSEITGRVPMRMRRTWRYVVFPSESGSLEIPPVEARAWAPGEVTARTLRTPPATVQVALSGSSGLSGSDAGPVVRGQPGATGATVVVLLVAAGTLATFALRRGRRSTSELTRIVGAAGHTLTLRKRLEEAVSRRGFNPVLLYGESSERGDAWRAAMSLVDRLDRELESIDSPEREVRDRARRLLDELDAR